ncbi:FxsA family protein [Escherichia coli]
MAWHRVLLFVAALCLIKPGLITDTIGLVLLVVVSAAQLAERRRSALTPGRDVV